jgi:hypothetical protein
MTKIETAAEARAMFLANDADAIEEVANQWWLSLTGEQVVCGVDPNGDVWLFEDTSLTNAQLVLFANYARETWN